MKRRLLANETNEVQISVTTPHYFPESGYMPRVQDKGLGLWCLTLLSKILSFISWRSILLVEGTGECGENH